MTLAVFYGYSNWCVIWFDSYFAWNLTLENITIRHIGSNFNSFISFTRHYLFTDFRTIFILVDDCLSSIVSSVSNVDSLIFSCIRHFLLGDTGLTSCIARYTWYVVTGPLAVSLYLPITIVGNIFTINNRNRLSQRNILLGCCHTLARFMNIDGSSNCFCQLALIDHRRNVLISMVVNFSGLTLS